MPEHNHASCDHMDRGQCPACDIWWREIDAHEEKLYQDWLKEQQTKSKRRRA